MLLTTLVPNVER